jgi:hypothetical protein
MKMKKYKEKMIIKKIEDGQEYLPFSRESLKGIKESD